MRRGRLSVLLASTALLAVLSGAASASGAPGPGLRISTDELAAALSCPSTFTHPDRNPVLLVHGTTQTAQETWGWNYLKTLPRLGVDTCAVTLPDRSLGDMQTSAEYVVYAVRSLAMRAATGRVDVLGHSQGVEELRWAVRWWPDVAHDVQRFIGLAGPDHGTAVFSAMCQIPCWASAWQERPDAEFMAVLNADPVVPGISYSMIYTRTDQFVEPEVPAPTSGVGAGTTVAVQDICPGRPVDHIAMLGDAVVFALVSNALDSPDGLAHSAGVDPAVCGETTAPGVDPADELSMDATLYSSTIPAAFQHDRVTAEPPLAPYARRD